MFLSISEAYRSATEDISDVRELIPEFFYMPEFFINQVPYNNVINLVKNLI